MSKTLLRQILLKLSQRQIHQVYRYHRKLINTSSVSVDKNIKAKHVEQDLQIEKSADEEEISSANINKIDEKFAKKLQKTTNKFWIETAPSVFTRIDWNRLVKAENETQIQANLNMRQCTHINIPEIRKVWNEMNTLSKSKEIDDLKKAKALKERLVAEAIMIPNDTHPASTCCLNDEPEVIYEHGTKLNTEAIECLKFCEERDWIRTYELGNLSYPRSYYLKGPLAELEQALIDYALEKLLDAGYQLLIVPEILYPHIIESCGFSTRGERDQVFWLENSSDTEQELCLSGTAEMSIASLLRNKTYKAEELPAKYVAVSRCFRAETSEISKEGGLYRVHQFTKVEMFGVTANETGLESEELHESFRKLEESLFRDLGLHFKTLEMPPFELGASAYRKFDIEAWMPGRQMYGEISSCSNCTDFQSRRLNMQYHSKKKNSLQFVHTVNGTACAIPRMLISIIENFQQQDGSIKLPPILEKQLHRSWKESIEAYRPAFPKVLRSKSYQEKLINSYLTYAHIKPDEN